LNGSESKRENCQREGRGKKNPKIQFLFHVIYVEEVLDSTLVQFPSLLVSKGGDREEKSYLSFPIPYLHIHTYIYICTLCGWGSEDWEKVRLSLEWGMEESCSRRRRRSEVKLTPLEIIDLDLGANSSDLQIPRRKGEKKVSFYSTLT
jgi:hypothetical protein